MKPGGCCAKVGGINPPPEGCGKLPEFDVCTYIELHVYAYGKPNWFLFTIADISIWNRRYR